MDFQCKVSILHKRNYGNSSLGYVQCSPTFFWEQQKASMTPTDSTPAGKRHARKSWSIFSPHSSHWEMVAALSNVGFLSHLLLELCFWLWAQEFHCSFQVTQEISVCFSSAIYLPYGAAGWALFWQSTVLLLQSRGSFHGHEVVGDHHFKVRGAQRICPDAAIAPGSALDVEIFCFGGLPMAFPRQGKSREWSQPLSPW